jgi:hypothetical protein
MFPVPAWSIQLYVADTGVLRGATWRPQLPHTMQLIRLGVPPPMLHIPPVRSLPVPVAVSVQFASSDLPATRTSHRVSKNEAVADGRLTPGNVCAAVISAGNSETVQGRGAGEIEYPITVFGVAGGSQMIVPGKIAAEHGLVHLGVARGQVAFLSGLARKATQQCYPEGISRLALRSPVPEGKAALQSGLYTPCAAQISVTPGSVESSASRRWQGVDQFWPSPAGEEPRSRTGVWLRPARIPTRPCPRWPERGPG